MAAKGSGVDTLQSVAPRDYHYAVIFSVLLAIISVGGTFYFDAPLNFDDLSTPLFTLPFVFGPLTLFAGLLAMRGFLRQRTIGTPVLEYAPARRGGLISGAVVLDRAVEVTGDYTLKLKCYDWGTRDHNNERNRKSPKMAWSNSMTLAKPGPNTGNRISFTMKVPSAQELPRGLGETYWQLDVSAPMRGVNFFARFSPLQIS